MKTAINILEQQLEWIEANRGECPHSDDYYTGYREATSHCIGLLCQAERLSDD